MAELIECGSCGNEVPPGKCRVCAFVNVDPRAPEAVPQRARVRHGQDELIVLDDGAEVHLGRMFSHKAIKEALRPYDYVSKEHAEIVLRGDRLFVRDPGSKYGTKVGGVAVGPEGKDFGLPVTILLGPSGHHAEIVVEWVS
ncbi:FHA domain-containing protein [Kutzneria chonburiensis]|uniref:FHA domain-containing protein n=1 Tax=Kutzneria chonburiensis TaxID=1483604 RepID=A0ABV6MNY8_9PSEU|nr:FHA domain-containing protein [Kutzneria chonburiensis]